MDEWATTGSGAGGAILGSILSFLGLKSRLDKLEERAITKENCLSTREMCRMNNTLQFEQIRELHASMKSDIASINSKLDRLIMRSRKDDDSDG